MGKEEKTSSLYLSSGGSTDTTQLGCVSFHLRMSFMIVEWGMHGKRHLRLGVLAEKDNGSMHLTRKKHANTLSWYCSIIFSIGPIF